MNIKQIESAIKKADNIAISLRELKPLMDLINETINSSPRTRGHINVRKTGITSYDYVLKPYDDYDEMKLEQTLVRTRKGIQDILSNCIYANLYGMLILKITYDLKDNKGNVPKLQVVNFNKLLNIDSETLAIVDENKNIEIEVNLDNKIDSIQSNEFYLGYVEGVPGGVLRTILIPECRKQDLMKEYSELIKKMKGIVLGTLDVTEFRNNAGFLGNTDFEIKEILNNLIKTLKNADAEHSQTNWLQTLKGVDIKLNQIVEAQAGQAYSNYKSILENDIAVAILGQANTQELPSGGGSRAAVQVLNLIRKDIVYSDMLLAKNMINDFLYLDYCKNYGIIDKSDLPYEIEFVFDDDIDIASFLRTIETAYRIGLPVSKSQVYQRLNLTAPEQDDILEFGTKLDYGVL